MFNNNSILASANNITLTVAEYLESLHLQRKLVRSVIGVMTEKLILAEATAAGISVTDAELQQASNDFRLRNGLQSAENTQEWLRSECLTERDFERSLESDILVERFIDHITHGKIEEVFAQRRSDFDQLRLRILVVHREDLAQELILQMLEEGRDFAELARNHSIHPSRANDGLLPTVRRHELSPVIKEALSDAEVKAVVGPVVTEQGIHLLMLESVESATPDKVTTKRIRQDVFDAWLQEHMKNRKISLPIFDKRKPAE